MSLCNSKTTDKEPIAIIGSGCRFPGGSNSPSKLWDLLRQPQDLLSQIPTSRFSAKGFYHPDAQYHGHCNVQDSYLLSEDHRHFDAQFFGIKPVEANAIDPQQRLLLETVYECIESAGQTIEGLRGSKTAVYVGLMCGDYEAMLLRDFSTIPTYHATGIARSIMSNRISYFFDWRGPSMTIDTACSSSLVAVHQAVQALRAGDCPAAIAAGSNLILGPENYVAESKLKMLSPHGRSRMWDQDADGYARGDGVAAIVLKTLSAALRDGDHIECLIRETGINQDGRTQGITVPSATAQATLIRDTYANAGLDPRNELDRCQYFEAHGTGTPAGDPIEAEAISNAFFSGGAANECSTRGSLYVGSIKTVIGHTEGTAGLAAVLKASLALQNATVPPNMLFNRLNPAVKPFYDNLEVPTASKPWPVLPGGIPRRASVNSFGFGGSNAHAILENYVPVPFDSTGERCSDVASYTPFTFSANSERSLAASLSAYSDYLRANQSVNLRDLAWTLSARRSTFPVRAAFSATSIESLCCQIEEKLEAYNDSSHTSIGTRPALNSSAKSPRILGIFTGQGAQYARLGADMILRSPFVRSIIGSLEDRLAQLPAQDRPSWSLMEELLADASSSRINQAAFAQPLSTAIQICLVDVLRSARVNLTAVVGHSSGEIGAAYAAGYISATDAICIAYYRGVHSKLACGADGRRGGMLAVGTSLEDAEELCEFEHFAGRIAVAACNSSTSVTISGDEDAIDEAESIFEDEKKFRRRLKVEKAYHSHHMLPCSEAYRTSLQACDIQVRNPPPGCVWYSSVYGDTITGAENKLKDVYWDSNMINPVLFSQAIEKAFSTGRFDVALEIGPHPALKGPATQTILDLTNESIPYTGLLARGRNDVEAIADGLGYLWTNLRDPAIDFERYEKVMSHVHRFNILKGLPTYRWDHDRVYWQESRLSRAFRTRNDSVHQLLGTMCADSTHHQLSWRNLLQPNEISWINGHQLQDQTVYPAAGYVATALEASKSLAGTGLVRLIEVEEFIIHQALVFHDDNTGIEILFTLTDIDRTIQPLVTADFAYYSAAGADSDALTLMASGKLKVMTGDPSAAVLPQRSPREPNMVEVETDRFYSSLEELGYGYTGPFKALSSMERKLGKATGLVSSPSTNPQEQPLMVHPAMLDAAIQSVILAYCYPNDGRLWSLHLPTSIKRIRLNPYLCSPNVGERALPFDSVISSVEESGIFGDVSIYPESGECSFLQLEGMHAVPFSGATSADDVELFSHMLWDVGNPDGEAVAWDSRATAEEYDLAYVLERVSSFYLRKLDKEIPQGHPARSEGPYPGLFNYASHVTALVSAGKHPYVKKEWMDDTINEITEMSKRFPNSPDLKIMHVVGEQMPRVIHGQTTILEHILPNGLLDNYYVNALGFPQFSKWLARMAGQIAHRHPHMNILEIGAGTGGATKGILKQLGKGFSTYVFTDISNGFFEKAQEVFKAHEEKMTFKALDIGKDVTAQGFADSSYDLIVASFVIHATSKLEYTMRNIRRLLKPGGYVLMAEVTNNDQIRGGFIFGALPGWWLGVDDGRVLSPCISPTEWDTLLRRTGFTGIDAITPDPDRLPYPGSVFVSQAVDDRLSFLKQPLSAPAEFFKSGQAIQDLTIVGGKILKNSRLIGELRGLLRQSCASITWVKSLEDVDHERLTPTSTVLSLVELDEPVFKDITPEKFESLRRIFGHEKTIVWVTEGRRAENPYSNMTVGFGRSQLWEVPDLRLQFLDFEAPVKPTAYVLAEMLLRFKVASLWELEKQQDDILWSVEPEIVIGPQGQHMIPRLAPIRASNDRYNSSKRLITKEMDTRRSAVAIVKNGAGYAVQEALELSHLPQPSSGIHSVCVQVSHSILSAFKTAAGYLYLALGIVSSTGEQVLALSETQASILHLSEDRLVPYLAPPGQERQFITLAAANILAMMIVGTLAATETLLVHEANPIVASVLSSRAAEKNVQIMHTKSNETATPPWVYVHPYVCQHELKRMMPKSVSCFVNLSTGEEPNVGSRITACLPIHCARESIATLFARNSHKYPSTQGGTIHNLLRAASSYSHDYLIQNQELIRVNTLALGDVSEHLNAGQPLRVIDWTTELITPVKILPVDSTALFADNKTYWLVGLAGGLGISLCEWMVDHGARFVVITSRNPKVDSTWLQRLAEMGAVVKVFSCDVTNEQELQRLYDSICSTFPPISGVAQGAMVLQDTATRDMTYEDLTKVLKPKVDGSIYLDRIFSHQRLDFFVFFSSMTAVIGNMGQANYTAANTFMCSLAAQRRKRGLAASVINIGVIIGVGYVTREVSQADQKNLRKGGYMWMSERDFHQIFAEAVLAGRPESGLELEISTGLRSVTANAAYLPIWYNNPKFANFVVQEAAPELQENNGRAGVSIKSRLLAATSLDEVFEILKDTFLAKLQQLLQLDSNNADKNGSMMDLRTDELGLDSLVAVEIRSWFFKNYQVNMPVLKILGGVRIGELLSHALENVPGDLIPNVGIDLNAPSLSVNLETASGELASSFNDLDQLSSKRGSTPATAYSESADVSSEKGRMASSSSLSSTAQDNELPVLRPILQRSEMMSFGQSMFWFVTLLLEDKTTLNHTGFFCLTGNLRINDLERAVRAIGQRHEALRTCFFLNENKKPQQGVMEFSLLHLEQQRVYSDSDVAAEFLRLKNHVYDLEGGQTMRIRLLSLSPTDHYLLIGCHHINVDGISHQVLMSDLENAYNGKALQEDLLQYPEFSVRQRAEYESGAWKKELSFWKKEYPDIPQPLPLLSLCQSTSRRTLTEYDFNRVDFRVGTELATRIRDKCRKHKATAFHFYLAAFEILLYQYTDADDMCIGIGDGNRTEADMLESIGPFVNMLPLRFRLQPTKTFSRTLSEARSKTYSALANSRVPFEIILDELHVPRSSTHSPIFQTFVDYRQGTQEKQQFGNCCLELKKFQAGRTAYDLSLDIIDNAGADALLMFMVQKDLYSEQDAQTLMESYMEILETASNTEDFTLDHFSSHRAANPQEALKLGLGPTLQSKWPETLSHRIDEMIHAHRLEAAVKDSEGKSLTYDELSQRVDSIAASLLAINIEPGSRVAVFQESTTDWICSMVAIMKVGAVYVPLDLSTPTMRLAMIVNDCQPKAIMVDATTLIHLTALRAQHAETINVSTVALASKMAITNCASAKSPAAILYTSGSTGVPKGIVIKHSSFKNEVEVSANIYGLESEVVLQQSAFSFDMSVLQIFLALALGGTLCMVPRSSRGDPIAITSLMAGANVSYTCATPSEYTSWLENGDAKALQSSAWRVALSGGEQVTGALVQRFRALGKTDLRLFNAYGPTETTCSSTKMELFYASNNAVPERIGAGFPSPNESIYIVDESLQLVPVGFPGEIVIGGVGLALGYLDNEKLTDSTFVPNIYATDEYIENGWTTMHRTGDKGRWLSDGSLFIEGRVANDTQIKLRGLRIDLRDVEETILKAADGLLAEAVVSLRSSSTNGGQFLIAHVVFSTSHPPVDATQMLRQLQSSLPLPQYMCPAIYIPLDTMPTTVSSKLDRGALSALSIPQATLDRTNSSHLSATSLELKEIWGRVLSADIIDHYQIDADTDFFLVGGNSILLMELQAQIRTVFDISLPLIQLFESSTLGSMALRIERGTDALNKISVDWEKETEVSPDLVQLAMPSSLRIPAAVPRVIVLTGATGFLGQYIVRRLVEHEDVVKIHCVAVRQSTDKKSLVEFEKVVVHEGDLSLPRLGLSEQVAAAIFDEADAVIHNGADVSHLKSYASLRPANVESTKEIVKMSLLRRLPIHYISTAGVALFSVKDTFEEVSASSTPPPTDGFDGYTNSKWASERYLEKVSEQYPMPIWIHRPSSIIRPSTFTRNDAPTLDLLQNLLRYSRMMKCTPVSPNLRGAMDLVSVGSVADGVVQEVLENRAPPPGDVRYIHQTGDFELPISGMKEFLEKENGEVFETLPIEEWADRAESVGLHSAVAAAFKSVKDLSTMAFPRFVKKANVDRN